MPNVTPQPVGRLYLDGRPYGTDQPYPIQQNVKKQLISQGFAASRIEIHKPIYRGIAYCERCLTMVMSPPTEVYDKQEYWRCRCGKMNFIIKK